MTATAHLVGPTDGRQVRFQGFGTRYVLGAEQTGGAFAVVEHDLAPRALGAPMHTHAREDEVSHVLAGRLGVQIGEEGLEAGAGGGGGPGETVVKAAGRATCVLEPGRRAGALPRADHATRIRAVL